MIDMVTMARAMTAYRKKDWDSMADILLPILPDIPDDGTPHTMTRLRAQFIDTAKAIHLPLPLAKAAARYLVQTSDRQLIVVAAHLHALAERIDDPRKEGARHAG